MVWVIAHEIAATTHPHTHTHTHTHRHAGFHDGSAGKESACRAGDPDWIPGWDDALEKEMVTHSSVLAWRIPWIEEPEGLQSTGSQRVRDD